MHNGAVDLWVTAADGSNPRRLTSSGASSASYLPAVAPRGDFVAFARRDRKGENIWRLDLDGSNLKQLTAGSADSFPAVSPDNHWVVFTRRQDGKSVLMRVPSAGGPAAQLPHYPSSSPSVSPDGKWIACEYFTPNQPASLAVVPFAGGQPANVFPQTAEVVGPIRWTPDGHAISFLYSATGDNIWEQPVTGGQLKPVTNLPEETVLWYAWSSDGRIAFSGGLRPTTDAVLVTNFR